MKKVPRGRLAEKWEGETRKGEVPDRVSSMVRFQRTARRKLGLLSAGKVQRCPRAVMTESSGTKAAASATWTNGERGGHYWKINFQASEQEKGSGSLKPSFLTLTSGL